MDEKREVVHLNGRLVPVPEARVSVFDAGFTHAAGLFETMRAYHGVVMRLDDHIERLKRSAALLDLQVDVESDDLRRGVREVLEANCLDDARLRLTVTPGQVPRPGESTDGPRAPTVLITAGSVHAYSADLYRSGMRVCVCPYKQSRWNPLAGHKTLAYLPRLLAMKEAAERKCNESLWFNTENQLAEGSVCNVFTVQDGRVVTPPVETPVLPGIVRKIVIEVAKADGLTVEERPIDIDALLAATEVFLTGSVMEIMPVTAVEKHKVGDGAPGATTKHIHELFTAQITKECGRDG